jgi:hypothetical protein
MTLLSPMTVEVQEKAILYTHWCVACWPTKEYAPLIVHGCSVCEKHFQEAWVAKKNEISAGS